jgi:glucans biosynthesis protein
MRQAGLVFIIGVLMTGTPLLWASPGDFSFEKVVDQARQLSAHPFQAEAQIPDFLKNITYDQLRDIRFKKAFTLWGQEDIPFKIRFFHLGFYYHWPVGIDYVDGGGIHAFSFSPEMFDYGRNDFRAKVPAGLGFAGFRIHYPINTPSYEDELAVFLGATYFRAVGRNELYGLSSRGLAVNTAMDTGEEFPFFKKFWIIKPRKHDQSITVYALLDSPSISGAYEYTIHPGRETLMHVRSVLFPRQKIAKLGIVPMTSMFLYGENSNNDHQDGLRPEVHDSDGLQIFSRSGEWVWRPLINPQELLVNVFEGGTPQGFGLFQRDEEFDHYQDLEARYDRRPSLWIMPGKDWGPGHVELVQIPSGAENNDNINAFWVPETPVTPGQKLEFSYTLQWGAAQDQLPPKGYVTATRVSRGAQDLTFEIDFLGKDLEAIPADKPLIADIQVMKGYSLKEHELFKNPVSGGWRLVFKIRLDDHGPFKDVLPQKRPAVGLRAFIKNSSGPLTETWDYAYTP